ncbi:hypothetical protein IV203_012486 [Nitzschia inconspicua]|uniref:Uncharacterized protein n=1 Tax=Nitzschia inconspicua TaxID=303405 RepID=A0A9K3PLZ3_9STRA|nr:hypothetical protein IV203_012486 [Nitzschia inconspicua]
MSNMDRLSRGQLRNTIGTGRIIPAGLLVVSGYLISLLFFCENWNKIPTIGWSNNSERSYKYPQNLSKNEVPSVDLSQFQVCRPNEWSSYVCQGPEYDKFADKMEALIAVLDQKDSALGKPILWGKRRISPFPDNTTVLAVGNSHTRQILQTLVCQYPVLQMVDMDSNSTEITRRGSYYYAEFVNHAKLHLVTNHAIFYSRKWRKYLRQMTGISTIDGIIVGQINSMNDAYNTSFMSLMMEKTSKLEDADFASVDPPQLQEFTDFYDGPIVAHSLMCYWGYDNYYPMNDFVQPLDRTNVGLVNGRAYIGMLGECSTNEWQKVGVCGTDSTAHRCIGERGGHPDLLAWDIVEALNDMMKLGIRYEPKWW